MSVVFDDDHGAGGEETVREQPLEQLEIMGELVGRIGKYEIEGIQILQSWELLGKLKSTDFRVGHE